MLCSVDFARHLALMSEPLTGVAVPFFWEGSGRILGGIWGRVLILIFFLLSVGGGEGKDEHKNRRRKLGDTKRKLKLCSCLGGTHFSVLLMPSEALFPPF